MFCYAFECKRAAFQRLNIRFWVGNLPLSDFRNFFFNLILSSCNQKAKLYERIFDLDIRPDTYDYFFKKTFLFFKQRHKCIFLYNLVCF
jgi:hypothetical protein